MLVRVLILVVVGGVAFGGQLNRSEYDSTKELYAYLTENSTNPDILPFCNKKGKVTVTVDLAFRELVELNQIDQLLVAKVWLRLRWNDCSLRWDPTDFGNVSKIVMPYEAIWIPDITLYEGASEEANMPGKEDYNAWVYNNGDVTYNFPSIITTTCRIDVTHFPFDFQNCSLKFGSWNFDGNNVDLKIGKPTADISAFVKHNEWELNSVNGIRSELYYECCPEPYPDVTFYVVLARRPKFYILTLFLPSIVIMAISLLGFMLPPQSGEKINIQITVLLSISVFLLLVQDKLPSSSETFPQLGVYFSVAMLLTCLSCAMTGIVVYIDCKKETSVTAPPRWLRIIFQVITLDFSLCRKIRRPRRKNKEDNQIHVRNIKVLDGESGIHANFGYVHGENSPEGNGDAAKFELPEYKERETTSSSSYSLTTEEDENEWELLSLAIDRFFMLLYVVAVVANICVFMAQNWSEMERMEIGALFSTY